MTTHRVRDREWINVRMINQPEPCTTCKVSAGCNEKQAASFSFHWTSANFTSRKLSIFPSTFTIMPSVRFSCRFQYGCDSWGRQVQA